jgi:hypothetical protein
MRRLLLPLWVVADVLLLFGVPIMFSVYVRRMVDEEYATGMRNTSDGDSIIIPVAGMFIFMLITLISINALVGSFYLLRRRRRRRLP